MDLTNLVHQKLLSPTRSRTEPSTPLRKVIRTDETLINIPMSDSRLRGRTRTSDIHLPPQELPDIIAALNRSGRSESRLRSRPRSRSRPRTPEAETPIRRSHRRSSDHYVSRSIRRRRSSTGMLQEQQPSYDPNYGGSITIGYLRALCKVLIEEQNRQAKEKQPSPRITRKNIKRRDICIPTYRRRIMIDSTVTIYLRNSIIRFHYLQMKYLDHLLIIIV